RLFEIGAEKAGVRKSAELRLRHVRACAERSCVPVIIEPAKINRRPSPSRRQWQRLDAFIAAVTVKLEKISRWVAKINQRGLVTPIRIIRHGVAIQPLLHQFEILSVEIKSI